MYQSRPWCNNNDRPLILLGSSAAMLKITDVCDLVGIEVAGIIDSDYWGNTEFLDGIPVIDSEHSFNDVEKLEYYRENFNFFCASTWIPVNDQITTRNRRKRSMLIDLIDKYNLNCISIVDPLARVSSSAKIDKGVFIDAFALIEPHTEINDFANIFAFVGLGHHTRVMRNSVIQRHCSIAARCLIEPDTFISVACRVLKKGAVIKKGTFIHEAIYIRRNTVENEIVSIHSENPKRVYRA